MKIKTRYRYIAWDVDGGCFSYDSFPDTRESGFFRGVIWSTDNGRFNFEEELINLIEFDMRSSTVIDTESEEDMKLLRALMEL